jgi:hypothetical protein
MRSHSRLKKDMKLNLPRNVKSLHNAYKVRQHYRGKFELNTYCKIYLQLRNLTEFLTVVASVKIILSPR